MSQLTEFRLRIRTADNTADALTLTSIRGGANPYLEDAPKGDGHEFDDITGESRCGAFAGEIVDAITGGTSRVLTSQLEDGGFRQQLMDRRAFLEMRLAGGAWVVLIAGFLTTLRLTSAGRYAYTVSDPTRAELNFVAFAPQKNAGTGLVESVATFLARWPNRGCLFGGPVRGGFLDQPDRGGWEMVADSAGTLGNEVYLRFVAGYAAPQFDRSTNAEACMAVANQKTDPVYRSFSEAKYAIATFGDANAGQWPGVIIELVDRGFYQPSSGLFFDAAPSKRIAGDSFKQLLKDLRSRGVYIAASALSANGLPAAGTAVRVRAFTAEASELSPIYWTGHPVDLIKKLDTEAGVVYNDASLEVVRQTIGAHRVLSIRVTAPQNLAAFKKDALFGPFGIAERPNDAGETEYFSTRVFANTPPVRTITAADIRKAEFTAFEIDRSTAVSKVVFEHQRLIKTQEASDESPDGFVVQPERFEIVNGDSGAVGNQDVTFTVPGMVHATDATANARALANAIALEVFDRHGRGLVVGELPLLRGGAGDGVVLGEELLNAIPQLPNHNKRLGDDNTVVARAMQIVRLTPIPSGWLAKLADSGPNAQPFATLPTLTIAASTDAPRRVAVVTITNAATLNAAGSGVRLQVAVTTGAAPASTDYTDVDAYAAGAIPTTGIRLPGVISGRKVYVRARSEKPGVRPSNYSADASVTLTAIAAPSALVATPDATDASLTLLAWTPGSSELHLVSDISLRRSADPAAAAIRQRTLEAGSTQHTLEGLTTGVSYTAGVQHRDITSGDTSALTEVTFTAGATTRALPAPVYPWPFAGSLDPVSGQPSRDGIYGIALIAAELPGFVEVAIATETAVGAGTYGAFTTSATIPSVQGFWTRAQFVAPNDGLRRQLKARHVSDGLTASAYSSVVTVLPWTPLALPPFPTDVFCEITVLAPSPGSDAGVNIRLQVTGVDPAGGTVQVKLSSISATMAIVAGSAVGTLAANNSIWRVSLPAPGSGPGHILATAVVAATSKQGEANLVVPEQTTLAQPQGTVAIDSGGNWEATIDGPANAKSFKYLASNFSYPSDVSVDTTGAGFTGDRTFTISGGPLVFGQTVYITAIPYTGASWTGTALPSIHIRGAYTTYAATKTASFAATNWHERSGTVQWGLEGSSYEYVGSPRISRGSMSVLMFPVLPAGVTVVSADVECAWTTAAHHALDAYTIGIAFTNDVFVRDTDSPTYAGGVQTLTLSVSAALPSGRALVLVAFWQATGATDADAGQAQLREVNVTYTMPTPDKSL